MPTKKDYERFADLLGEAYRQVQTIPSPATVALDYVRHGIEEYFKEDNPAFHVGRFRAWIEHKAGEGLELE